MGACVLALTILACERPKIQKDRSVGSAPGQTPVQAAAGTLLTERDGNRIYFIDVDTLTYVVWQAIAPSGSSVWKSGNTYGGAPHVELADMNGDGSLDLFWALQYEENLEGKIVLNRKGQFVRLAPKVAECQQPQLERDNGRYLYVAFVPGAYRLDDCLDVTGLVCVERFHANWPRFYAVVDSTMIEIRPSRERYLRMAALYRSEAARFDSLYALDTMLPAPRRNLSHCYPDAGQRMRKLADSAQALTGP
jgi:hypothetical protein